MTIEIRNLKYSKPILDYHIRVCRNSSLGNPFFLEKESKRDFVCNEYEKWFWANVRNQKNKPFNDELKRIISLYREHGQLVLFCWCEPKRCHAETIKNYIEITGDLWQN